MTADPVYFSWESTPALWRCCFDPEGPSGFGKTKEIALGELIDLCDNDRRGPHLLQALVAAIEKVTK